MKAILPRACTASLLFVLAPLPAQQPASTAANAAVGAGAGLQVEDDGTLVGFGTAYKALFGERGFEFTPVLGSRAPRNLPLAFELAGVGRGDAAPAEPGRRHHADLTVRYEGAACTEILELRPEGIEQSFRFDALPPGRGDLVVRGRLRTELEGKADGDGILFEEPGLGGVSIRGVLGIDAAGRRQQGHIRLVGTAIEYVLPERFVDTAELPLVLDPLLAPVIAVETTAADDRDPDVTLVAFPSPKHFVVWRRVVSALDSDVMACFVEGPTPGALIGIETGILASQAPRATTKNGTCVVVWQQAGNVLARGVFANGGPNGTLGSVATVAATTATETAPDVGGGIAGGFPQAVCVWLNTTTDTIEGASYTITGPSPPVLTFGPAVPLVASVSTFTTLGAPAIARTAFGQTWLVAFTESSSVTGTTTVRALVVDETAAVVASPVTVAGGGAAGSASNPDVDGDVAGWMIAYEIDGLLTSDLDVACRAATLSGGAIALSAARTFGGTGHQRNPAVACLGRSCLVAYASENGSQFDVRVHSIEPETCADCEGAFVADTGGNDAAIAACGDAVGDQTADSGAIVWVPLAGAANGNLALRRFDAHDGEAERFNGCASGSVRMCCARPGNAGFAVAVRGSAGTSAALLLGLAEVALTCGTCTFRVDPFDCVVVPVGPFGATGAIRVPLPLPPDPNLVGRQLVAQAVVAGPSACLGLGVGQAERITIE